MSLKKTKINTYYIIKLKCPAFNYHKKRKKIISQTKTQKTMAHSNKSTEIVPEKDLLADSIYKGKKKHCLKEDQRTKEKVGEKIQENKI